MAAMKEFPDKFFDLAVVDPPYGDGRSQSVNVERERESRISGTASEKDLTDTNTAPKSYVNRGGWHGKQKYHLGTPPAEELPEARRNMGLCELAGRGQRSTQKNYFVGCCAGTGLF